MLKKIPLRTTAMWMSDSVSPAWSVGFALVARRAKAELTQAIDSGYAAQTAIAGAGLTNPTNPGTGQPVVSPGPGSDGFADVQGSSWAYGYKLGLTYDPSANFHMGLGYQSAVRETIKGTVTYSVPSLQGALPYLQAANPGQGAVINQVAEGLALATTNGAASAVLNLPATISLGMIYDISSTFSMGLEISDTKWSTFKELRVHFGNSATQPDQVTEEDWKDALFVALGATCKPGNNWTYRVGVAMDNTPVPDANRTPRIPDADRFWLSAGVGYQFTKAFGVDAGYTHLICKNSTVNLQGGSDPTDQSKYFGGNLSGTYKNSIDVLAVQARYKF